MATEEDFDRWIEITMQCKYLPENELKVTGYSSLVVLCSLRIIF